MRKEEIYRQIENLTSQMVAVSLCDMQQFPSMKDVGGKWEISIKEAGALSIALKNVPYHDIYSELDRAGTYNLKMIDGALIQMLYSFDNDGILCHRLAFFPSPVLEDYENDPELYEADEIYADIIAKNIVPFPIRFDFDRDDALHQEIDHPKSHLTLGQFKNCRIPVSAPLTPFVFIHFVLRHFYNTAFKKFTGKLNFSGGQFEEYLTPLERSIPHMRLIDVM
jgi:hypothetical protein